MPFRMRQRSDINEYADTYETETVKCFKTGT